VARLRAATTVDTKCSKLLGNKSLSGKLPDWDITTPELRAAWERGERDRFYPYGKSYGQVFGEQE
jgi:hypothetical protein